jgi:manganese transport protein
VRQTTDEDSSASAGVAFPNTAAWRSTPRTVSLQESYRSVAVPRTGAWDRKLLAFAGPGFLVAVGYMDPGNWATDLAAGSAFGYRLLAVVLLSSLMAMVLQALAVRLGIATGRDLAQACRDRFSPPISFGLWVLAEIGICACDLAELLGTALGLKLLLGVPLLLGVCLTTLDVILVLALQRGGFRRLEAIVVSLMVVVGACFAVQVALARPVWGEVVAGFVPTQDLVTDPRMVYLAIGILGATIMPHNLYLHSSIVQTRRFDLDDMGRRLAARMVTWDSTLALTLAMLINAAILVLAAASFHANGAMHVNDISQAHTLLTPLLGAGAAALFAIALLAAGQNASVTATLAGQIVMEGFLRLRLSPWKRRLLTRLLAVVPAIAVIGLNGERALGDLLILSQVVLSLQLPFAVVPLAWLTGDRARMGPLVSPAWLQVLAWAIGLVIVALNLTLLKGVFESLL